MIGAVVTSVRDRIETALQAAQARDTDWVELTNVGASEGTGDDQTGDRIVMTVAAIQQDGSVGAFAAPRQGAGDGYAIAAAPLFLDVYVAFVSTFTRANYAAGLGLLSRIVTYFQEHPVFEAAASPEIGAAMGRLAIEHASLDFHQSSNLATTMGVRGMPFLVYRLRRLPFAGPGISGVAPAVQATPPPAIRSG